MLRKVFDRFRSSAHRLHVVPSDVLRRKAVPFASASAIREAGQSFVQDMTRIMRENTGVGIAAPQIGVSERVFCMEDSIHTQLPLTICFNPRIVRPRGSLILPESCLSVPDQIGFVKRARRVRLIYTDEHAQEKTVDLSGFWAVIAQHELDHLDGVLCAFSLRLLVAYLRTHICAVTDKLVSRLWSSTEFENVTADALHAEPFLKEATLSMDSQARFADGTTLRFP